MSEQGYTLELKKVEKQVQMIQTQITNIKLKFKDVVIVASTSIIDGRRENIEETDV